MFEDFGILIAEYNSVLPTLADGDKTELQVDSNGRLLVQADVSVIIDALGLNGAGDDSNILIVGSEDGTGGGTRHVVKVAADGSVYVIAEDLDIRDLSAAQDNVAISDGTDTLEVNADGSINVKSVLDGAESYAVSDSEAVAGDGLISFDAASFADLASIAVGAGETLYIYGWQTSADKNAVSRIVTVNGADVTVLKVAQLGSAAPNWAEHWSKDGRIEVAGAAGLTVRVQAQSKQGTGSASGSLHARKE